MEKIVCIGPTQLTDATRNALLRLIKATPSITRIECCGNVEAVETVDDLPHSISVYFPLGAPVEPTLLSESLYQCTAISRCQQCPEGKEELDDKHFVDRMAEVNETIPQFAAEPLSLQFRELSTNADLIPWNAELGGPHSFVGSYFQLQADHRTKDYFFVARGGAPVAARELKQEIAVKRPTFQEFLTKPEWTQQAAYVQHGAERNVLRNLATMAECMECGIERVQDVGSKAVSANHGLPERAEATWKFTTHGIDQINGEARIYYGMVPRDADKPRLKEHFLVGDASSGIHRFGLAGGATLFESLPSDTGRGSENSPPKTIKSVLYEGKNAPKLRSANPLDDGLRELMQKQGGWNPVHHVGLLVPVAVKCYNPEMRRERKTTKTQKK